MTNESSAVVVRKSSDLEAVAEFEGILISGKRVEVVEDPQQISREILMQLLGAETDEELEQFGNAQGWGELEGVPVRIKGFTWRPSAYEEGAAVFVVVQGERLDTGEPVVLTCGGLNVMAQLANMARRGTLVGAIREIRRVDKATRQGYFPLYLQTPDAVKQARAERETEPAAAA